MTAHNRQPPGRPTGGQFSETPRADADVTLGAPAPAVLGASRQRGTFGPYSLANYKQADGREGPMWSAELRVGKESVALITQDGHGGQTFASFTSREASEAFTDFVAREWDFPWEADLFDGSDFSSNHTEDSVLDAFGEEYAIAKKLKSYRSRKTLPVASAKHLATKGGIQEFFAIKNGVGHEGQVRQSLERDGLVDGAMYFDGTEWRSFD